MAGAKILFYLLLAFISGIGLNSFFPLPQIINWGFLIIGLVLGLLFWKSGWLGLTGLLMISFSVGIFWCQQALDNRFNDQLSRHYGQEITFQALVSDEPSRGLEKTQFQIDGRNVSGRALITTGLYPEYHYGDKLEIKGKIQEPAVFETFNYRDFLAKDKIYSVIYYPEIKPLAQKQGNWFFEKIFGFKAKLSQLFSQVLRPPQSSVLIAAFLGDESMLSQKIKDELNLTGTRHIIAISGMNMVIMSQILLWLALAIGLWRQQAFYLVLIVLALYIVMIGAPASAFRAGLMAGLLLLAQKLGRLQSAGYVFALAAAIMLIVNPLLLKFDVGFQLSFLATLSLVYLKPFIDQWIEKLPNYFQLKDVLTMTIAAQLGTLPLLIFHFGRFSLISPLANILIVPLLPFLMISGIVLGAAGFVFLPLAKILAYPVWLILTYMVKVIDISSRIPLAAYQFRFFHWLALVGYYLVVVVLVRRGWREVSNP